MKKYGFLIACLALLVCLTLSSCGDLAGLLDFNFGNSTSDSRPVSGPGGSSPDGAVSSPNESGAEGSAPSDAESSPEPTPSESSDNAPDSGSAPATGTSPDSEPSSEPETPPETDVCAHSYTVSEKHATTCTVDGYTLYVCGECGDSYVGDVETAPGHSYGDWQVVTPPEIGVHGLDKRVCGACGHENTRETSVGQVIEPRLGNGTYGYYEFSRCEYGEEMQQLYRDMLAACEKFAKSTENVTAVDGIYVIEYIDVDCYEMSMEEMAAVWKIFTQESPAYYWIGNLLHIQNGKLYLAIDESYAEYSHRQACDAAIAEMAAEASALIHKSDSDLEKAMKLHDYLVDRLTYAYIGDSNTPETAIWAHNLDGAATRKGGVCETYSKSFMYLCGLNGVECLFISGYAGGPHAWNYVRLDDSWYAVDVTWDDGGSKYFKYDNFGMSYESVSEQHVHDTPDVYGLNYLFPLPELEERDIMPVVLYENDVLIDTFDSVESALAAMVDPLGEYRVELGANDVNVSVEQLPAVKSITFVGLNEKLSESTFYGHSTLIFEAPVTFGGNVVFKNVNVVGNIDIGAYTLTTEGIYCELLGRIIGDAESAGVKVNTTYKTEITADVEVDIEILQGY